MMIEEWIDRGERVWTMMPFLFFLSVSSFFLFQDEVLLQDEVEINYFITRNSKVY